jgi:amino acid transporter
MLGSHTALNAVLSLSTIALVVCYVSPTLARITWGRRRFTPGPFNLGKWAYPIGGLACSWALFSAVVFCLPTEKPVTVDNLNYAAVAFLGTLGISLVWFYCPGIGAYRWFEGPFREVDVDVVVSGAVDNGAYKDPDVV